MKRVCCTNMTTIEKKKKRRIFGISFDVVYFDLVTSLSSSPIRLLRYTSTEILFAIQLQLCKIIASVESSLERSQRQLSKSKIKQIKVQHNKQNNRKLSTSKAYNFGVFQ